ncbi:MAG: DUF4248 domain-containing protein [Bacteroidota bacterium]
MNDEKFKMRAYSKGELAQLYFPVINKESASKRLREWIKENKVLLKKLKRIGYTPEQKIFSPAQVKAIVEEFGEPG